MHCSPLDPPRASRLTLLTQRRGGTHAPAICDATIALCCRHSAALSVVTLSPSQALPAPSSSRSRKSTRTRLLLLLPEPRLIVGMAHRPGPLRPGLGVACLLVGNLHSLILFCRSRRLTEVFEPAGSSGTTSPQGSSLCSGLGESLSHSRSTVLAVTQ